MTSALTTAADLDDDFVIDVGIAGVGGECDDVIVECWNIWRWRFLFLGGVRREEGYHLYYFATIIILFYYHSECHERDRKRRPAPSPASADLACLDSLEKNKRESTRTSHTDGRTCHDTIDLPMWRTRHRIWGATHFDLLLFENLESIR